jgi:hypothetical protein
MTKSAMQSYEASRDGERDLATVELAVAADDEQMVVGNGAEGLVLHAQTGLLAFDEARTSSLLIVSAAK